MTKQDFDQLDKLLNDTRELRNQRRELLEEKEEWEKSTDFHNPFKMEIRDESKFIGRVDNRLPFELVKKLNLAIINRDLETIETALENVFNNLRPAAPRPLPESPGY